MKLTGQVCPACGTSGSGRYCSACGQPYEVKRITLPGLIHEVFHLFTHLDKGFGYTLKSLILRPGTMQRAYMEGARARHQKPFSTFFICATLTALLRYWIYRSLLQHYEVGSTGEVDFFNRYMVLLHVAILPLYAAVSWLLFRRSGYNYAETGVLLLYTVSVLFLLSAAVSLLKFIWPGLDTAYVEFPIALFYQIATFRNFYHRLPFWSVALRSAVLIIFVYGFVDGVEDAVIGWIS